MDFFPSLKRMSTLDFDSLTVDIFCAFIIHVFLFPNTVHLYCFQIGVFPKNECLQILTHLSPNLLPPPSNSTHISPHLAQPPTVSNSSSLGNHAFKSHDFLALCPTPTPWTALSCHLALGWTRWGEVILSLSDLCAPRRAAPALDGALRDERSAPSSPCFFLSEGSSAGPFFQLTPNKPHKKYCFAHHFKDTIFCVWQYTNNSPLKFCCICQKD